ncbi:hypothetical protein [Prevotella intermedia]|uniref:hypothetical protein n=1 Tax=Prevotella intermedia TaxID=28131 RepID=UPI0016232CD8|nr:hypothetical protein [Prevotella intermedia]
MKLDGNILKVCKGLVMNCNCKILIFDVLGEHRVFLVNADLTKSMMRGKSRVYCP